MIFKVNPCAGSEIALHTAFGRLYNKQPKARDRMMPGIVPFYRQIGSVPHGIRAYNTPPILAINLGFGGRFAIADQPRIERPPTWERIIK
jgi:hypothetical protein